VSTFAHVSSRLRNWKPVLVVMSVLALLLAVGSAAGNSGSSSRSGALHVTKECSEYDGTVGAFCTITSSNIPAIQPGMKVVYLATPGDGVLDSAIALGFGQGTALGHVLLDLSKASGRVRLSVGTGRFSGFRALAAVSVDEDGVWHWDGSYRFVRSDDAGNGD
jgi:hypothetical protein